MRKVLLQVQSLDAGVQGMSVPEASIHPLEDLENDTVM